VFITVGLLKTSLGKLAMGVNDGLASYSILIPAELQGTGTDNLISFEQISNVTWKWGVTNVQLRSADLLLVVGADPLTDQLGNQYPDPGSVDPDGVVTASFDVGSTPVDLVLAFDAFDVDLGTEIEILVNGVHHSFLTAGANEALSGYSLTITAAQQTADATNVISFVQSENVTWKWGVTNVQLRPAELSLVVGAAPLTDQRGNKYPDPGSVDEDGVVTASFDAGAVPVDLVLAFDAFDVDLGTEIEILVNGVHHSFLAAGANDALSGYILTITAAQQIAGATNVISFVQSENVTWKWGVTNIQLDSPLPTVVGIYTMWSQGIPDPSGIAYDPATGRMLLSDAEIDESPFLDPTDIFAFNLDGLGDPPVQSYTPSFTSEPTGLTIDSNLNRMYISDDDDQVIYVVDPSDPATLLWSFSVVFPGGPAIVDAEDVAVDPVTGHLFIVNGLSRTIMEVELDHTLQTATLVDWFTLADAEITDPEALAYDPVHDVFLVGGGFGPNIWIVDRDGNTLEKIDLLVNFRNDHVPGGTGTIRTSVKDIELAPASDGTLETHIYVADFGNSHVLDGRIIEIDPGDIISDTLVASLVIEEPLIV
jgi:hypothetical protein